VDFAAEMGDDVTGEGGVGQEPILPVWVSARHLPSICASIDATKTETKVHCIYRFACLCKDFKKILCEDAPLHEVLHILGARKFSQMRWFEKRTHALHLLRYIFGVRLVGGAFTMHTQRWQDDIEGFLARQSDKTFCAFVAHARFYLSATEFEKFVLLAGRDVSEILAEVDEIAVQRRAGKLALADFLGRIPGVYVRLRGLATEYLRNHRTVQHTMDLMKDYYKQHIASTAEPTSDDMAERLNVLSGATGVLFKGGKGVGKGTQKRLTKLHESFVVNGWYLLVRVTQEGGEASVSPHATSDRIVYSVDNDLPIKVLIRNIGRDATVTESSEDDVDFGKQQLVITNPTNSSSPEKILTIDDTVDDPGVTLMFDSAGQQEINIDELQFCPIQKIQTAVLRIVLRPKPVVSGLAS